MTATATLGLPGLSARIFNTGASTEAKRLEGLLADIFTAYRWVAPRYLALAELARVYSECLQGGWDGYSAKPISADTYNTAARFLMALPAALSMPDVVPEPDGEISLEWDFGEWKALSLSIGPDGRLAYAALLGQHKRESGSEIFDDVIPPEILSTIWKVTHP